MPNEKPSSPSDRRDFLKKSLALACGGAAVFVPIGAGVRVLLDPLRRGAEAGTVVRVASLEALPADGIPRQFPVVAARTDAWNKFDAVRIGAVYLRRTAEDKVEALNAVCPHAGCFVDFVADRGQFRCPCHESSFTLDGKIANKSSPSPRALDSLPVKVDEDGAVWVTFQNFEAGLPDKVPVA